MVTQLTGYNTQRYTLNSLDDLDGIDFHNGDQVLLMDLDKLLIFDEENSAWYDVPAGGGGGGGGTQIQAPFKVASGSYTPASNGKDFYLPLGDSGISVCACVYIECEDTVNYATTYDAYKPVLLYLMFAYPHNIFGTGGNVGSDISYLASDGTLGSYSTLGGGSVVAIENDTLHVKWTQGVTGNTGVTYNYIVVGV